MTTVLQKDRENQIPEPILADSIVKISEAMIQLNKTGINRKCVIDLIHVNTKLSRKVIVQVLDGLESLKKLYINET